MSFTSAFFASLVCIINKNFYTIFPDFAQVDARWKPKYNRMRNKHNSRDAKRFLSQFKAKDSEEGDKRTP